MNDSTPLKRCSKCGVEYPATTEYFPSRKGSKDGLRNWCRICKRNHNREWESKDVQKHTARKRQWRLDNPELMKACRDKWEAEHPENLSIRTKTYREKHPEIVKQRTMDWRLRNPQKVKAMDRRSYFKHKEKVVTRIRVYQSKNIEKVRLWGRAAASKRRSRKLEIGGSYCAADVQLQFKSQNGKCWWCGCELDPNKYHIDHRIALSRGGTNWPNNICCSCPTCNLKKNNKMPWEWNGRLL